MAKYYVAMFLTLIFLVGCSTTTYRDIEGKPVTVERLPDDAPLEERLAQLDELSYVVTYKMTVQSDHDDDSVEVSGEITQYVDSSGNLRQDGAMDNEEIRQFIKNDKTYACIRSDEEWSCGELPKDEADVQNIGENLQMYMGQYPLPFTENKKIGGTNAACYGMSAGGFDVEYCFSPEGVPVLMKTESSFFLMRMEAKSYSLGVNANDFELPAELGDINAISEESA